MTSAERQQKQTLAKTLFLQGMQIKEIAERINISANSISKWAQQGEWSAERAARNITRPMIVQKMLAELDKKLEEGTWSPQEIAMLANSISKIDKTTNVVTIIEVFTAYQNWLAERAKIDPDIDKDFLQKSYKFQDQFVTAHMQATTIN